MSTHKSWVTSEDGEGTCDFEPCPLVGRRDSMRRYGYLAQQGLGIEW